MVHLSRIAITVTLAALVSSCTTQPNSHAPGDRDTPPDFEPIYTSSWSAEPGIDLLSREAELIRATFESSWQTEMYSITNSFPGYREAIGYPHPSIQNIVRGADAGNTDWDQVSKHTIRYHITELIETPTDITASICDDIVYTETTTNDHITRHGSHGPPPCTTQPTPRASPASPTPTVQTMILAPDAPPTGTFSAPGESLI